MGMGLRVRDYLDNSSCVLEAMVRKPEPLLYSFKSVSALVKLWERFFDNPAVGRLGKLCGDVEVYFNATALFIDPKKIIALPIHLRTALDANFSSKRRAEAINKLSDTSAKICSFFKAAQKIEPKIFEPVKALLGSVPLGQGLYNIGLSNFKNYFDVLGGGANLFLSSRKLPTHGAPVDIFRYTVSTGAIAAKTSLALVTLAGVPPSSGIALIHYLTLSCLGIIKTADAALIEKENIRIRHTEIMDKLNRSGIEPLSFGDRVVIRY